MSSNEEEYVVEYGEGDIQEYVEEQVPFEEFLIDCVRVRPILWDSRLPITQRGKTARDNMWLEIYKEFGELEDYSIEFLSKKWRNLRDTYVRVKGEQDAYVPTGSAAKKKKKNWQYFEIMSFLSETLARRSTISNLKPIVNPCSPSMGEGSTAEEDRTGTEPEVFQTGKTPKGIKRRIDTENAIIDALNKVNSNSALPPPPSAPAAPKCNEICIRISELLEKMPVKERTKLEIELLQIAFKQAEPYL